MKQSIHDKACRVGLKGVRFHDAGKVTRVTELDAAGFGIGEISVLNNTTAVTLARFYIQSNRQRTFDKYKEYFSGRPQTEGRPKLAQNEAKTMLHDPIKPNESKDEISVKYSSIFNSSRDILSHHNFRAHSSIG